MRLLQQIIFVIHSFILSIIPITTYVEGITGQPGSFLPTQAVNHNDVTISRLIYRGLFEYDTYGNLIPDLAESWEISGDGLVYTVTLKRDQKWTDGTNVTADDVIYTAFRHPVLQVVGTDRVDERTIRFILPNKYSPFLGILTSGIMKVDSDTIYNPLKPASNGDFRVLSVEHSGPIVKQVVLINNNSDEKIRKLVFRYYGNEDELVTAAKLGEIDGFLADDTHEISNFSNHRFPIQGVYYALFFDLNNETLKDITLRQTLEKVLNKEQIIYNKGIFVQGPISRSVYTDNDITFNPYDETIQEDLEINLEITIPDLKEHEEVAESIKQIWKDRLDVDVDIVKVDPKVFLEEVVIPRRYEILLYGQEISRDPSRYVNWHSTQREHPGLNLSNFEHVRADRALEESRNEIDADKRVVHYNEFQKVIAEQVPAIFLYHPFKQYYVSKYIKGIGEKYTFTAGDRFLDFNNWEKIETN